MYRLYINRMRNRANRFLQWIGVIGSILAIMGLVTFSLFIHEEAFQTAMFGTWPAQDAGDWKLVKRGTELMSGINGNMKRINNICGWIQPLSWFAYDNYGQAADFYVKGLRAKVFAHQPELFDGEEVEFTVKPREMVDGWLVAGKVRLAGESDQVGKWLTVRGVIHVREGLVYVQSSEEAKRLSD